MTAYRSAGAPGGAVAGRSSSPRLSRRAGAGAADGTVYRPHPGRVTVRFSRAVVR
jgi:hypothetical protein